MAAALALALAFRLGVTAFLGGVLMGVILTLIPERFFGVALFLRLFFSGVASGSGWAAGTSSSEISTAGVSVLTFFGIFGGGSLPPRPLPRPFPRPLPFLPFPLVFPSSSSASSLCRLSGSSSSSSSSRTERRIDLCALRAFKKHHLRHQSNY